MGTRPHVTEPAPARPPWWLRVSALPARRLIASFDVAVVWAALTAFCWYVFGLVPIQVAAAGTLGLDQQQTSSLIFIIWITAGVGTLVLSSCMRQPIALSMQIPTLIYVATLSSQFTLPQLMGGILVAGLVIALAGILGIVGWALRWIPPSIAMAVFVGSVFGVLTHLIHASLTDAPVVGATVAGYVVGCLLKSRLLPPIGAAAIGGAAATVLAGRLGPMAIAWAPPTPSFVWVELDPSAILTVAILVVVYCLMEAPRGVAVLADQGYSVKVDRLIMALGAGTVLNALFGGGPAGLSNDGGAILAGPEAGAREHRYRGAVVAGGLMFGIALLAEPISALLHALPREYVAALVGLAILRVAADGCRRMFGGPLNLAPLVTFVVATGSFTLAGIGAVVWALVIGMAVACLLELPDLRIAWHDAATGGR
jgi:benzoate membrane transport protein